MTVDELLAVARQYGIPIEDKQAWWKIGTGGRRVYVKKGREASRIHFTGLEELKHAAITPMSKDEAANRHLGLVRGETVVSDHSAAAVLDAFTKALRLLRPDVSAPQHAPVLSAPASTTPSTGDFVVVRISSPELIERLRAARVEIQASLPPGVELDDENVVRVLLHEALAERERGRTRG